MSRGNLKDQVGPDDVYEVVKAARDGSYLRVYGDPRDRLDHFVHGGIRWFR